MPEVVNTDEGVGTGASVVGRGGALVGTTEEGVIGAVVMGASEARTELVETSATVACVSKVPIGISVTGSSEVPTGLVVIGIAVYGASETKSGSFKDLKGPRTQHVFYFRGWGPASTSTAV